MTTASRILYAAALCLATTVPFTSFGAGNTSVRVLSATTKDKAIDNANVTFQKNGWNSVSGQTDTDGRLQLRRSPFKGIDDESVLMIVTKPGYSALVVKCPCDGMTYALSENMRELDGIRIVLNWGARPADLDAHLASSVSWKSYQLPRQARG